MIEKERNKGEQCLKYNITERRNKGIFDAPNDISDNMKLLQLMNEIGNFNHTVSTIIKMFLNYILKDKRCEIIFFIINMHISLIFNIVSKFDFIKDNITVRVS